MGNWEKISSLGRERSTGQDSVGRDEVPPVGRVLRRAREHHGLSIRQVERRIGRSSAYLSQIERGLIRQPDPVVLLELADLYRIDFMSLARWAGWTRDGDRQELGSSPDFLVRRVLELNAEQRAEVLGYIERVIRQRQS